MTIFKFYELLAENVLYYAVSLFISFLVYYIVFIKSSSSWFSPLRFNILTSCIGFSVVFFLFLTNNVSIVTFIYLIISFLVFWVTFLVIYKNNQIEVNWIFPSEKKLALYLFYISYFVFGSFTLYSYNVLGIPLFNELDDKPRLATYTGSGLGYISRILPIFYSYCIFYLIYKFDLSNSKLSKIKNLFLLIPFIITGMLSGSRSSFLAIVFVFWGYRIFYLNSEPELKKYKLLLLPFALISLTVFSIQSGSNLYYSIYLFLERVVSSGDLYWDSLPDDNWKNVVINNPFKYTFMGFLGPLRILDANNAEIPIGYQLTEIIFPTYIDKSTGPVALFPIYGLICFGYIGGIFLSFVQAVLASVLLKFTFIKSKSVIICSVNVYLYNSFLFFLGDISAALGMLLNGIISIILFGLIILMIIGFSKTTKFNAIQ